eukprot:365975-Chlamydomonas_euryale.AAC.1
MQSRAAPPCWHGSPACYSRSHQGCQVRSEHIVTQSPNHPPRKALRASVNPKHCSHLGTQPRMSAPHWHRCRCHRLRLALRSPAACSVPEQTCDARSRVNSALTN